MDSNEKNWKVNIEEHGRSGAIRYVEHQNEISFDYELSGGGSVVMVWGTEEPKWNETYQWAVDRCRQIYERVAESAILQKAPTCKYVLNLKTGTIDIYEP
jgi:hypothetical protein